MFRLVCTGSSITVGSTNVGGASVMTPMDGSGLTSWPYYMANYVSGARGSLVSQNPELANIHVINAGSSGQTIPNMIARYHQDVGLLKDYHQTDNVLNIACEIGNTSQTAGYGSTASIWAEMQAYWALHQADGIKLIWMTSIDRGAGNTDAATAGANTGWYTDATYTALSPNGIRNAAINALLRTNWSEVGNGYIDIEALAQFAINPLGAVNTACRSTTWYNAAVGDYTHLAPVGYELIGQTAKAYLDSHDSLLYTLGDSIYVNKPWPPFSRYQYSHFSPY